MSDQQASKLQRDSSQDRHHAAKAQVLGKILREIDSDTKRHEKPEKSYICYADLKRIWSNKSRISISLQPDSFSQEQLEFIQTRMIIILSTLIYIGASECLASFRARLFDPTSGIALLTDDGVPFERNQLKFLDSEPGLQSHFYKDQFRFKPVVIEIIRNQRKQVIKDQKLRLPFEYRQKGVGEGGHGQVDRVGISPRYIKQENGVTWESVYEVACKKIKRSKDFDLEVNNLQILKESLSYHSGIMLHLATIEHGPYHYILLPYARYGDLEAFLHCGVGQDGITKYNFDTRFDKVRNSDITIPLLRQCQSLANALAWLHNGIESEESSIGKWMISDFDISVIKERPDRRGSDFVTIGGYFSRLTMNTRPNHHEGTYQPPEVQLANHIINPLSHLSPDQKSIGRKSDIWSYGCILSEILAFSLGKDVFVLEFQAARKGSEVNDQFYIARTDQKYLRGDKGLSNCSIRPSVLTWLDNLCGKFANSQRWVDCYVGTIKNILIVDAEKRPDATQLSKLVDHVMKHVAASQESKNVNCPISQSEDEVVITNSRTQQTMPTRISSALSFNGPKSPPLSAYQFTLQMSNRSGSPLLAASDIPALVPSQIGSRDASLSSTYGRGNDTATVTTSSKQPSEQDGNGVAESTLPTTVSGKPNESEEELDDAQTIITDNQSLDLNETEKERLVNTFATTLWENATTLLDTEKESAFRISAALPWLLKEFSQDLSATALPGIQQDATTFIRHYRKYIANSFQASVALRGCQSETSSPISDQLTLEEKMDLWKSTGSDHNDLLEELPQLPPQDSIQLHGGDDKSDKSEDFGGNDELLDIPQAMTFLFGSAAFNRLRTKIRTASHLTSRSGQTIQKIRDKILDTLTSPTTQLRGKSLASQTHSAFFQVSWNPLTFLEEQYGHGTRPEMKQTIALTGSAVDAQATTCGQYAQQLWPETGVETLDALQAVIIEPEHSYRCILANGTKLEIQLSRQQLLVNAAGTISSLADIGEQLSWLSAACRASPNINISYSTPKILAINSPAPSFVIDFSFKDLKLNERSQDGTCWHQLFSNPVIAQGFPILARSHDEKGLEIPLNMMARLGEAERATVFGDQLVIKGFSTIFVPTLQVQNSVIWHFLFNKENVRMPYTSAKDRCPIRAAIDTVNYSCLTASRTFLGWASSVLLHTGSSSSDYSSLRFTGSNLARPGCALEKVTISGGKYITAGATFVPGKKDSMLSLSISGPYQRKMHSASRMNVILYDTLDRRGWLVDGASALMHMTRAQLSRKPYYESGFDLKSFPHTDPADGYEAALKALGVIASENPVIFEDKPTFGQSVSAESKWGLKDMVLENWHILEQIQDYQGDMSGPGMLLRQTDRDKLEGFGFLDIIDGEAAIRPRVAVMESSGRGWVDFTREIKAITLMARGFGDLMTPAEDCNSLCTAWEYVPKDMDYLIARVRHLQELCERGGNVSAKYLELVQGLYWHQGGELFEPCYSRHCPSACERVQVLLPKYSLVTKRRPNPFEGNMKGAVIFGRSNRISKWWPRNPKIEPKDDEAACLAEDARGSSTTSLQGGFHDSGLGTEDSPSDEADTSQSGKLAQPPPSDAHSTKGLRARQSLMSGEPSLPTHDQNTLSEINAKIDLVSQLPGISMPTLNDPSSTNGAPQASNESKDPAVKVRKGEPSTAKTPHKLFSALRWIRDHSSDGRKDPPG